jgi:PucR family transcriptional regulator, purine catabolism regulatory protein
MVAARARSRRVQPGVFTVRELLEMECLEGSELLAGAGGLDRVITGLNIVEVPDVWRWLRGGELLFSSGFPWRENPARLADVLTTLDRVAVSAVAFKLGQYLRALPGDVLATADELGLPLLRLPAGLPYRDVIEPVYERLTDVREAVFERSLEVKQKFTRFGLDDQSIEKIAAATAREVSRPVKVFDWLDGLLYVASPEGIATVEPLAEDVARAVREQLDAEHLGRNPRIDTTAEGPVLAAGLVVKHETHGAMVVEGFAEPPDAELESKLGYAIELISFLLLKRLAVLQGRREAADLFFRSLLSDSLSNEEAAERALTLGIRITQPCAVLIAGVGRGTPPEHVVERLHRTLEQGSGSIQRAVPGHLPEGQVIALVQAADDDVDSVPPDIAEQLVKVGAEPGGEQIIVASGSARTGLHGVRRSKSEALIAFTSAQRMGLTGLVRFADLRVERLLSQIPDVETMRDYVTAVVGPIENDPQLLRTLEVYLEHGRNKVATAAAIPLHRSSLVYRLRKVSEALDVDIDDPERGLELWLALKLRVLLALGRDESGG